jgi:hypothetical protein
VGPLDTVSRITTADPFPEALTFTLGRLTAGDTNSPRHLDGDIAEVLIYERAVPPTEQAELAAYLRAKWGVR